MHFHPPAPWRAVPSANRCLGILPRPADIRAGGWVGWLAGRAGGWVSWTVRADDPACGLADISVKTGMLRHGTPTPAEPPGNLYRVLGKNRADLSFLSRQKTVKVYEFRPRDGGACPAEGRRGVPGRGTGGACPAEGRAGRARPRGPREPRLVSPAAGRQWPG